MKIQEGVGEMNEEILHCPWCNKDIYHFLPASDPAQVRLDTVNFFQHIADCMYENMGRNNGYYR
jgi:hypothetical protein